MMFIIFVNIAWNFKFQDFLDSRMKFLNFYDFLDSHVEFKDLHECQESHLKFFDFMIFVIIALDSVFS